MRWLLIWVIIVFTVNLSGCKSTDKHAFIKAVASNDPEAELKKLAKNKQRQYNNNPDVLIEDAKVFKQFIQAFLKDVTVVWGKDDAQVSNRKRYVKYTNKFKNRAIVDFEKGVLRVETMAKSDVAGVLTNAITLSLLTPEDPEKIDLFSDKEIELKGKPFLYQQVHDHDGKAIAYQWRANRFATYLVKNQLKKRKVKWQYVHYLDIPLVTHHQVHRKQKYKPYVDAAAKRYQLSSNLIYAIIETESSFNPFAVSSANAYGLMQVVPATAGRDVYDKVKNKSGQPSKQTLFNPAANIDIGSAYLHLLSNRYLKQIKNQTSRHYSMISAYNGGAGNVFNTFSSTNKGAISAINRLSSSSVYQKLTQQHPRSESRRYLEKVNAAQKRY